MTRRSHQGGPGLAAAAGLFALLLASCAIPRGAPLIGEIRAASRGSDLEIVPISAVAVTASQRVESKEFPADLVALAEIDLDILGAGDRLAVSIWDGGAGGMSLPTLNSGKADLPSLAVGPDGRIEVPYAGPILAAGRTVEQVRSAIIDALRRKIFRPQVAVQLVEQPARVVTVRGEVDRGGVVPLKRGYTRLSSLLAVSGAKVTDSEQLRVELHRAGRSSALRLAYLQDDPQQDIALRPGDTIILTRLTDRVTVIGAAGVQGRIDIARRDFSLLDAIALSRGLSDELADPRGLFLLRRASARQPRPTAYQVDIRDPAALLLAGRLQLHDGDVVLVANASFTSTRKVLLALSSGLSFTRAAGVLP